MGNANSTAGVQTKLYTLQNTLVYSVFRVCCGHLLETPDVGGSGPRGIGVCFVGPCRPGRDQVGNANCTAGMQIKPYTPFSIRWFSCVLFFAVAIFVRTPLVDQVRVGAACFVGHADRNPHVSPTINTYPVHA